MFRGIFLLFLLSTITVQADFVTYTGVGPNYRGHLPRLTRNNNSANFRNYNRMSRLNRYNHLNNNYAMYRNGLSALENYALKKNYSRDSEINRLERLEMLAFGAIQDGDIGARFQNVENAILTRPQNNYQKSGVLAKIGNFLSGQPTGFTPSFMPGITSGNLQGYGPFGGYNLIPAQGFSNNTVESYSNGLFGSGYSITGNDYGGGSSVKILD